MLILKVETKILENFLDKIIILIKYLDYANIFLPKL